MAISTPTQAAPSPMDLLDDRRNMQVGDRLIYQVEEEQEPPIIVFVDDRGHVEVPLIGLVEAEGKTPRQLAHEIRDLLEVTYFHRATVRIEYQYADRSRGRITLAGQVTRPGPMSIPADEILTVSNALLRAGGFTPGAERSTVQLVRRDPDNPDDEQTLELDMVRILEEGIVAEDIPVQDGDLIVVPRRDVLSAKFIINGSVLSPGLYDLPADQELTVSEAILKAGGFAKFANRRQVRLIRADKTLPDAEQNVLVDVRRILETGDRSNDPVIKPDDIIRVEENWINF